MNTEHLDYLRYVNEWMNRPENVWRSFTMWSALYDYCVNWSWSLYDLWIEDTIDDAIISESWADPEWVRNLSTNAKLEIVDISFLDELGREIEDEVRDHEKNEIFDELESIDEFQTREEFEKKVQELCEDTELDWESVAEQFEQDFYLVIKEEEDDE